ncbi:hypothetical protein GW17_00027595, partial [Ensete ventricosum]
SNELNRLYAKFLKRNPGYDGKVYTFDVEDYNVMLSILPEAPEISIRKKDHVGFSTLSFTSVKVASTFQLQNKDKAK